MYQFPKPVCDQCGREIALQRSPVWDIHESAMLCSFKCATKHRLERERASTRRGSDRPAQPAAG